MGEFIPVPVGWTQRIILGATNQEVNEKRLNSLPM